MSLARTGMAIAGSSYGGRLFWVPFAEEGNTLHFGFSYSVDDPGLDRFLRKWLIFMADAAESVNPWVLQAQVRFLGWKQSIHFRSGGGLCARAGNPQGEYANSSSITRIW